MLGLAFVEIVETELGTMLTVEMEHEIVLAIELLVADTGCDSAREFEVLL